MSHRARSRVWEVDGGTVVRCKVNGLEPPSGSGARRSETLGSPLPGFSFDRSGNVDARCPRLARPIDRKSRENRPLRQPFDGTARISLTLTIFDALVLLIVATRSVADGGARFATFVVGAAILDGGAALLAAIGPPWIQAGDRGTDREHCHGQQSDRLVHLGAVANGSISVVVGTRPSASQSYRFWKRKRTRSRSNAGRNDIERRFETRCVDHARENAAKLWAREATRCEQNERNAKT